MKGDFMGYKTISVETKGSVGILSLNRPEVLNALSDEMRDDLIHFMRRAAEDDRLRVLIMTGKGRAFSAGGDLNMFKSAYERYRQEGQDSGFGGIDLPKVFTDFPKPLIAAVNGAAVGFGLTVTLTCDIRLASTDATFSCAFVRVGVTPEFGSSYFLPRLIGYGKAAELAFTAKMFDAEEAARIGLVNRIVEPGLLLPEAEALAKEIAGMPPEAVQMTKRVLRHGSHSTLEQVLPYESLVFHHCSKTKEHYEAVCGILDRIKE
jgi:2-(1,2-epoxy-1,2-dihydrophenyl)acetyl-CoA isomerase